MVFSALPINCITKVRNILIFKRIYVGCSRGKKKDSYIFLKEYNDNIYSVYVGECGGA